MPFHWPFWSEKPSLEEDISALREPMQNALAHGQKVWTSTTLSQYPEKSMLPYEVLVAANDVAEAEFALIGVTDEKQRDKLLKNLQSAMAKYMAAKLARE